jgi:hypothetical protein
MYQMFHAAAAVQGKRVARESIRPAMVSFKCQYPSDSSEDGILPTFDSSSSSDPITGCLTNSLGLYLVLERFY